MTRRLLEGLKEGVLRRDVQGFCIVDNRDSHRGARGLESELADQGTDLFNQDVGAIGGPADAREIRMHGRGDLHAGRAAIAACRLRASATPASPSRRRQRTHRATFDAATEVFTRAPLTQKRVCQRRGDQGLADSTGAGEQVGVGRPSLQLGEQTPGRLAMGVQTV